MNVAGKNPSWPKISVLAFTCVAIALLFQNCGQASFSTHLAEVDGPQLNLRDDFTINTDTPSLRIRAMTARNISSDTPHEDWDISDYDLEEEIAED